MSLWRTLALLVLVGFAWILPQECLGQTAPTQIDSNTTTGPTPYGSFGGVHENINLGTGDLTLQVPLLTLPGRNGFDLSVGLTYDSKVWVLNYMVDPNNPDLWDYWWDAEDRQPAIEGWSGGWRLNLPTLQAINYDLGAGDGFSNRNCFEFFIATLPDGRQAQFLNKAACSHTSSISHQTTADPASNLPVSESQEGSFLRLDTTNPADIVLYEKNGTRYHFSTGWVLDGPGVSSPQYYPASSMIDANGNTVTITSTVDSFPAPIFINSIKDSLGRTVTFTYSSAETLTSISYKDSNGTSRTISFGYSQLPLNYTFANPPNSGTFLPSNYIVPRLTSITLPNGLGYTFGYNSALAELNKITYPTGGYTRYDTGTFTYLWRTGRPPTLAKVPNPQAADYREITARHVCRLAAGNCTTSTEDTTTYTPTIDGNKSNNLYMDVVGPPDTNAPSGNKTRHQFPYQTSSDGIPLSFANILFAPRETNTTVYQGLTTALRTIKTDYNQLDSSGRPQSISFPIRVTTTLNDSNTIMKTEWDYDTYTPPESGTATPIDNVTEERDFDYGVPGSGTFGPLRRRTDRTWLKTNSINGTDYTATAIHILNRKASEIVYDSTANTCNGQTRACSQTNYEYDNFTLGITASGAVQHNSTFSTTYKTRGNLTATMRWRNTDGATLTTRNQYDDAGT